MMNSILSKRTKVLLLELVRTEFKLRYQDSVLGFVWSVLKPLLMFAILYFVFGKLLRVGNKVEHYAVYLLLGIVLWNFFVEATSQGLGAIVARGNLLRKINFPKYIVVVSGTISAFINLSINMLIIAIFMVLNGVKLLPTAPLFIFCVFELYIGALSIAFFLAATNVKYRDMGHIWDVILQAAFYATPILYPVSLLMGVNALLGKVLMLNPVAQIVQDARFVLITHQSETTWSTYGQRWYIGFVPIIITAIVAYVASNYFRKRSPYFAEKV